MIKPHATQCKTKQVLSVNWLHVICCLANLPPLPHYSAVTLILACDEIISPKCQHGTQRIARAHNRAKQEMWSKSGKGNVFIKVSHTWSHSDCWKPARSGNDPQKLLFICGDLLMVGQMGRALRGGVKSWNS